MFTLTDEQRLVILSSCVGVLGLVIVITACLVCPPCWLSKKITKKQKKEEQIRMEFIRNSFPLGFLEKEAPPPYEPQSFVDVEFNRRSVQSNISAVSDSESVTGIPLPSLNETTDVPSIDEVPENPQLDRGSVCVTLQYKKIIGEDKKIFPQLRVDLKEACDLQPRGYGGRCNPYFKVLLYDRKSLHKRRKSKSQSLFDFHSTVMKKSLHPVYNESFFFPLDQSSLRKSVLKMEAWDQDSLVNDTLMGETLVPLKDVAPCLVLEPSRELDLNLKLEDSKMNNGQVLLGLCYLPTAERMTVAVLKANNLKKVVEFQEGVAFYVQAMAIYAGKIFEKRKTSKRPFSQCPVFNEMLMFDVPYSKLDHVAVLLAIYRTSDQLGSSDENGGQKKVSSKDLCMGKVVIGSSSRKQSLNHWNAMRHAPRRQVIQWHELR